MAPFRKGQFIYFYDTSTEHLWKDTITLIKGNLLFFENYQPGGNRTVDDFYSHVFNIDYSGLESGLMCQKNLFIVSKGFAKVYKNKDSVYRQDNNAMSNSMFVCKHKKVIVDIVLANKDKEIKFYEITTNQITRTLKHLNDMSNNLTAEEFIKREKSLKQTFLEKMECIDTVFKDKKKIELIASVI
jgi:hypothetical protein